MPRGAFPLHTTAVVVALTIALLALGAGHTWVSYERQRAELDLAYGLQQRVLRLLSEGPTLAVLVRVGVETGNPALSERYVTLARDFETALRELRWLLSDGEMARVAFRMDQANAEMTATELSAFARRRRGRVDEALALISSEHYLRQVRQFDADNQLLAAELRARSEAALDGERRRALLVLTLSGLALPLLLAIWAAVLGRMRAYLRGHREAATALRESEQRYRALFDSNAFPMCVYDPRSLAILAVNRAAVERYGYTRQELLAMTLRELRAPADMQQLLRQVETIEADGEPHVLVRHLTKDGAVLDVEVSARAIQFGGRPARLATIHDVTERKKLEEQFRQAQKMEAVGRLAGGVAHDFNNVLNVILGYTELTLRSVDEGDRRRRNLLEVRKAADHAAGLTRQLLAFGRGQVLQPRVIDLNTVVGEMERMLRRVIGEDVDLVTALAQGLGRVKADPGQIGQVILNLAINARDAMPQGGKLTIETSDVELDARTQPGLPAGRYVRLAVTDTGSGMTRAIQEHIFEPFFTTKEKDKGTGLGLATVYGIVKQSGGAIAVYSEPGAGSTFKIYLPRVEAPAEPIYGTALCAEPARGSETILLVEDDPAVRGLTREVLEESGYSVLEAASGGEALELVEGTDVFIHLLLTDVVMPRMNGRELARRLQSLRPGLKALYMSGYAPGAIVHQGVLEPGLAFIAKPLRPADLTRKVREVLDGRAAVETPLEAARVVGA